MSKILEINSVLQSIYKEKNPSSEISFRTNSSVPDRADKITDNLNYKKKGEQMSMEVSHYDKLSSEGRNHVQETLNLNSSANKVLDSNDTINSFFPQLCNTQETSLANYLSRQPSRAEDNGLPNKKSLVLTK